MRHRKRGRKLGVSPSHRKAMGRNLVQALIDQERIVTTVEKAKQFQPIAEKVVHLGKLVASIKEDGDAKQKAQRLNYMRRAIALIGSRSLQLPVTSTEVTGDGKDKVTKTRKVASTTLQKLVKDIGPRYLARGDKKERNGGYTRIVRLARRRLGDNASQCLLELTEAPWTKIEKA